MVVQYLPPLQRRGAIIVAIAVSMPAVSSRPARQPGTAVADIFLIWFRQILPLIWRLGRCGLYPNLIRLWRGGTNAFLGDALRQQLQQRLQHFTAREPSTCI